MTATLWGQQSTEVSASHPIEGCSSGAFVGLMLLTEPWYWEASELARIRFHDIRTPFTYQSCYLLITFPYTLSKSTGP